MMTLCNMFCPDALSEALSALKNPGIKSDLSDGDTREGEKYEEEEEEEEEEAEEPID